jgi:hypothetical protein
MADSLVAQVEHRMAALRFAERIRAIPEPDPIPANDEPTWPQNFTIYPSPDSWTMPPYYEDWTPLEE